jgi:broad specificity phosphatase PhoE
VRSSIVLTVLLIRHAACDHVGRLIAGRAPGIRLNQQGREQARALAEALARAPAGAADPVERPRIVYASPLERATETAEILGRGLGVPVDRLEALTELDFGAWTGRTLESLEGDPIWRAFNEARGTTRIPGGELMADAVERAMTGLRRLEREHPGPAVAAVSHGDVIRGVLLHCLGIPLDHIHRLEVAPASVSVVRLFEWGARVATVNWRPVGPLAPD